MKYQLLLFAVSFAAFTTYAQATKGSGSIVIIDTLNIDQNFNLAMLTLIEDGYEIDRSDREFGTITTKPVKIPSINAYYYIYVVARDRKITVSGKMRMNISDFSPIENKGMNDSPARASFEAIEAFAKTLRSIIEYQPNHLR